MLLSFRQRFPAAMPSGIFRTIAIATAVLLLATLVRGACATDDRRRGIIESDPTRVYLLRTTGTTTGRDLFDLPHPFDFYNTACASECDGNADDDDDFTPFYNACPKCPDKYESQHCNHCCFDGASSLKLRWHGCPGDLAFASPTQGQDDCGLDAADMAPSDDLRFIDCDCYDTLLSSLMGYTTLSCTLGRTFTVPSLFDGTDDICIVSISPGEAGTVIIDLSRPLPPVVGLVHTSPDGEEEESTSPFWNPYPLTTYFDTTCNLINETIAPYVLPLFPGYGKFPNTCPQDGFIDLQLEGYPNLPNPVIDHYDGEPPVESFWYEFIDGTSAGFWPQQGVNDDGGGTGVFFDPTFATCSCRDCGTPAPVVTPSPITPSVLPAEPTTLAPVPVTPAPVGATPAPTDPRNPGPGIPTTQAPTTPAPVDSTSSPTGDPTPAPVDLTPSPTLAPVDSTSSPTPGPTPAPVDPTAAPVDQTLNPTPAPVNPTASPTPTPVDRTPAPVGSSLNPTPAPVNPTASPTPAPVDPTPAPVVPTLNPTPGPVYPTASPTLGPVDTTPAPVVATLNPTPGPVNPTDAPTPGPTPAPVDPTPAPVDPTASPTPDPTPAPVGATLDPTPAPAVDATPAPTDPRNPGPSPPTTFAPVSTPAPIRLTPAPVGTIAPIVPPAPTPTILPAEPTTLAPLPVTPAPVDTTPAPTDPRNPGPGVPTTPAPTPAPVDATLDPTPAPVDQTSAPTPGPTSASMSTPEPTTPRNPGPGPECTASDYASCLAFSVQNCVFSGSDGSTPGDPCSYTYTGGRRQLALALLHGETSPQEVLRANPWMTKTWILEQMQHHKNLAGYFVNK